jgi:hypothetical protein
MPLITGTYLRICLSQIPGSNSVVFCLFVIGNRNLTFRFNVNHAFCFAATRKYAVRDVGPFSVLHMREWDAGVGQGKEGRSGICTTLHTTEVISRNESITKKFYRNSWKFVVILTLRINQFVDFTVSAMHWIRFLSSRNLPELSSS